MTSPRLAYDDASSAAELAADCAAVRRRMRLARRQPEVPAPSLPGQSDALSPSGPVVEVSEAAARLAGRLHLHLD